MDLTRLDTARVSAGLRPFQSEGIVDARRMDEAICEGCFLILKSAGFRDGRCPSCQD